MSEKGQAEKKNTENLVQQRLLQIYTKKVIDYGTRPRNLGRMERPGVYAKMTGSCGGCPGGNVERSLSEMKKNGVQVIHLATGLVVGYPPCPWISRFAAFIREAGGIEVVFGTHPIPQNYYINHEKLGTWVGKEWEEFTRPTMADEAMRLQYD